jgi:hypothetical protein
MVCIRIPRLPKICVETAEGEIQADNSRAPSYFSQFFQNQLNRAEENGQEVTTVRTLYIDRDPVTFKDISLHLQGYHVKPQNGSHFVKLFADAQFYSCKPTLSTSMTINANEQYHV